MCSGEATVGKVVLDMAVSLDGYICGPNGEDGGLHDWYFAPDAATAVTDELLESIGAMVMGHRAFGIAPDGFDTPYKVPHFVLTHQARPTVSRDGASFVFVTGGLQSALDQARLAAGTKDVCVAGGADTAQQFLKARLIDEMQLHLVPVLLGGGVRLFEHLDSRWNLQKRRVTESAHALHLTFGFEQP